MAIKSIMDFIFQQIGNFFDIMNKFEIFPGVKFGFLVIGLSIFAFFLNLFMDNVYSDLITYDNIFNKGPDIPKKYVGRHTNEGYLPYHNFKERKRRGGK